MFLGSLETAQESIKTANMAYEKVLNTLTATLQQGETDPPLPMTPYHLRPPKGHSPARAATESSTSSPWCTLYTQHP